MKHSILMTAVLLTASLSRAEDGRSIAQPEIRNPHQLEQIQYWLQQLEILGALDVNEKGNVRVKESIIDQLIREGRISTEFARTGSICE